MKKLLALLVLGSLLIFPVIASANGSGGVVIIGPDTLLDTSDYYSDNTAPRNFDPNEAYAPQSVSTRLNLSAMLPCYLEMTFVGNDANAELLSYGPGAAATYAPGYYVAFHPGLGGYIDADWATVSGSTSSNAHVSPFDGNFIRGCDTFMTVLWSNMNYKYEVKTPGLSGPANLPIDMRVAKYADNTTEFSVDGLNYSIEHTFSPNSQVAVLENGANRLQWRTFFHQFRVPYSADYPAGHYRGTIEFVATTI